MIKSYRKELDQEVIFTYGECAHRFNLLNRNVSEISEYSFPIRPACAVKPDMEINVIDRIGIVLKRSACNDRTVNKLMVIFRFQGTIRQLNQRGGKLVISRQDKLKKARLVHFFRNIQAAMNRINIELVFVH